MADKDDNTNIVALGLLLVGGIGLYAVLRVASQGLRWDRFLIKTA